MRTLIVEAGRELQHSVSSALRDDGFAVDVANEGRDGLFSAQNYEYDAVVINVELPVLDGWCVLRRLRQSSKVPVLMLSRRYSADECIESLSSGADDYLAVPFVTGELVARVRALIRRSAGNPNPQINFGDYVIDMSSKKVMKQNRAVPITGLEYGLIEYLALNRGKVVSRTELYAHIFDEVNSCYSNTLEVKISRIRSKLGKSFITTHRGLGYSIN